MDQNIRRLSVVRAPVHLFSQMPVTKTGVLAPIMANSLEEAIKKAHDNLQIRDLKSAQVDGKDGYQDSQGRFFLYTYIENIDDFEELLSRMGEDGKRWEAMFRGAVPLR